MSLRLAFPVLAALAAAPSQAQPFQGMEYDQGLNMALQEMLNAFGGACQTMGDPNACGAFSYVQQTANYMVGASDACLQGDPMGCQAYQMAYQDVSATYAGFSQAMQGGMGMDPSGGLSGGLSGGVDPLGATHGDRMGAIAQFGADNTAAFNSRMQAMDGNMAQFQGMMNN